MFKAVYDSCKKEEIKVDICNKEIQRLRKIIIDEGEKWARHHASNPELVEYWNGFVKLSTESQK